MDLSIIIVNYKSKKKLLNCLRSIQVANFANLTKEIIVVDNNSGDDLQELQSWPELKIVFSAVNLGMGGGNNLGIKQAQGEYMLVLNPDTLVQESSISSLLNYYRLHPEIGIIGPKLLYPDNSLQLSCLQFPTFFMPILRRTFLGDYFRSQRDGFTMSGFDHDTIKTVDWLMGSCLLFKKVLNTPDAKQLMPSFDERFFMYFEDIDLCRTIKNSGLQVVYYPLATVIHDHARQSAKNPWYIAIFKDKLTWIHISSWFKYFIKWGLKNPL
jgi:GT2 family glycosyltransferase